MSDTVVTTAQNTVTTSTTVHEPIVSAAQGPQGPQGIPGATSISTLTDISYINVVDGVVLVYNATQQVWVPTTSLTKQTIECGQY
jgi:hypothetical protein